MPSRPSPWLNGFDGTSKPTHNRRTFHYVHGLVVGAGTAFRAVGKTRQTDSVPDADLSFLPEDFQRRAIRTPNGEVMWPREMASEVVAALAAGGKVVVGLDLRSDGRGTTPSGLSTEIEHSSEKDHLFRLNATTCSG